MTLIALTSAVRRGVVLLMAACAFQAAWAQPAQIILLRHGEKPDDPENAHLSMRGQQRAMALAPLLAGAPELLKFGPPAALYAPRPTPRDRSRRAYETLLPSSEQSKIPLQTPVAARDYDALAKILLQDRSLAGKSVVVSWPHDYLPDFAAALGVTPKPSAWKGSVYDRFWVITFPGGKAAMADLPQRLLFGDSKK